MFEKMQGACSELEDYRALGTWSKYQG